MATNRWVKNRSPLVGAVTGLLLSLLILGPALMPGFLLSYDMVFVPQLDLSARTLGVDGSVPRAVPNDAVVALLSLILPGHVVQKLVLVSVFVGLGTGMGLVLKKFPAVVVATVVGLWNPWVAQRLEVGHWGFLLGYAVLPWVIWAGLRVRSRSRGALPTLGFVMLIGSLSGSTGTVLMLLVLAGVLLGEGPREWKAFAWGTGIAGLVSATWWWPFLRASSQSADPNGVTAFAARADTPWGVIVSVATGGGSWNQSSWYPERASWMLTALAFLFVIAAIVVLFRESPRQQGLKGVGLIAVISLILATMSALPGGRELFTLFVANVPGAGLLRDSQKLAGPWIIAVAMGAGILVQNYTDSDVVRARGVAWLGPVAGVLVPVILLPSLAWGSQNSWRAVDYPAEMITLAEEINRAEPGAAAVFPWIQYRRFEWNNNRIVLDPWNRLLSRDVIVNDSLPLRDATVAGEDQRAQEITRLLMSEKLLVPGLRALGVRHVVVLDDQPNQDVTADRLTGAELRYVADGLQWWDLGEVTRVSANPTWQDFIGWILAGIAVIVVAGAALVNLQKHKM